MLHKSCSECLVLISFMVVITLLWSHRAVTGICGGRRCLFVRAGHVGRRNVMIVYLVQQQPPSSSSHITECIEIQSQTPPGGQRTARRVPEDRSC